MIKTHYIFLLTTISLVFLCLASTSAQQYRKKEHKLDAEIFLKNENNITIEIPNASIDWISPVFIDKQIKLFYGSTKIDSMIFTMESRNNLTEIKYDTIPLSNKFKIKSNTGVCPIMVKSKQTYPLLLYSSDSPFEYSILNHHDSIYQNSDQNISSYFTNSNKIIMIVKDDRNILNAFYLDTRYGKGVVMLISSIDYGMTWSFPVIALSDNKISFIEGVMTSSRTGKLYFLGVDKLGNSYLSTSTNGGISWKYPKKLSDRLDGYGHSIVVNRSGIVIVYRYKKTNLIDELFPYQNNDYLIYTSSVNVIDNGGNAGNFSRLTQNSIAKENNINKMNINHISKNRHMLSIESKRNGKKIITCYIFGGNFYL